MNTITQVERGGLFEISEATLAELKSSKYYNDDLAPTSISERSWTTYSITMLWVGMAICIPSLSLASGLIGLGVSPWLSVLNVALGNILILIPIQLNSQIGTKYGIPFPLFARLTFCSRRTVHRLCDLHAVRSMGCIQRYRPDQMGTEHRIPDPDRGNDRTALLGLLHYSGRNRILRSYGSAK